MATKPTVANAAFATDTNFSSGDAAGTPVKVAPTAIAAQGWRPGDALGFVGAWFNYLINQAYLWFLYVDDLHNSADFLNKSYTWLTGVHRFTNGLRSVGIKLESGDLTYSDSSGTAVTRTRAKQLTLVPGLTGGVVEWSRLAGGGAAILASDASGAEMWVPIELPGGVTLTTVRAWVKDAGAASVVSLAVYRVSRDPGTGTVALGSPVGSGSDSTGSSGTLVDVEVSSIGLVIDNENYTYEAKFTANTVACEVHLAYCVYSDPGFVGNK